MPKIPRISRRVIRQAPGVVLKDPSAEVAQASALGRLGSAIVGAGETTGKIIEREKKREKRDKEIRLKKYENLIKNSYLDALKISETVSLPDGSNLEEVTLGEFDLKVDQVLDDNPVPEDLTREVQNLRDSMVVSLRTQQMQRAKDLKVIDTDRQVEEYFNSTNAYIRENPEVAAFELENVDAFVDSIEEFDVGKKKKIKEIFAKEAIVSASSGLVELKQYDKAEQLVKTVGVEFIDAISRERVLDTIDRARLQDVSDNLKTKRDKLALNKLELEEQSRSVVRNFGDRILASKNLEERDKIREEVRKAQFNSQITNVQAGFLLAGLDEEKVYDNNQVVYKYTEQITKPGANFSSIRTGIQSAVKNKTMQHSTATGLLNALDIEEEQSAKDPFIAEERRASNATLDAAFGVESQFLPLSPEEKALKGQALTYRAALIRSGDSYTESTLKTIAKFKGNYSLRNIPFAELIDPVAQSDSESITAAGRQLKHLHKTGKISKEVYLRNIKILHQRNNAIKLRDKLEELGSIKKADPQQEEINE